MYGNSDTEQCFLGKFASMIPAALNPLVDSDDLQGVDGTSPSTKTDMEKRYVSSWNRVLRKKLIYN